jgi:hypothetical protein
MRGPLVAVLALAAGCGFTGHGQGAPNDDAKAIDAPGPGSNADAAVDQLLGPQCPVAYASIVALAASPSRYRFVGGGGATWLAAETDCANDAVSGELATHLIVLDDAAEKTAMIGGLTGGLAIPDQWIGATDLAQEGEIAYVTVQTSTLSLAPTANADNKDCVRIKNTGVEEYRNCDETNKYVCECDGQPADPVRFPNLPDGNGS